MLQARLVHIQTPNNFLLVQTTNIFLCSYYMAVPIILVSAGRLLSRSAHLLSMLIEITIAACLIHSPDNAVAAVSMPSGGAAAN